ncbi:Inositol monophosphatase 3 [Hypsibius exemplaris]|uniref:inositol-phosphate phosphatase n=1 Tax=Hypsibius exemplaris TaxID=2072580 RepID=A0A1W0X295_HYPEX|nr:Inositol monophosphatase 3 [Hypsibius exemplaris]
MPIQWNYPGILAVLAILCISFYLMRETLFSSLPDVFNPSISQISLRSLLCVSILAAQRGGLEVKRVHDGKTKNVKDKDGGTINPVTDGDFRSHYVMMRTLVDAFPGLKVISEEHDDALEAHHTSVYVGPVDKTCPSDVLAAIPYDTKIPLDHLQLWIDPLDATQEYTEDLLDYVTTMVGIAIKGRAVGGVIHKPFATAANKKIFWAWKDQGISENLKNSSPPNESLKIIISRSHSGNVDETARTAFAGQTLEIIPAGGAGYKTVEVLTGRANVYLHTTKIKKWDLCAPNGLLNAVGGRLSTLAGTEVDYTAPVVANDVVNTGGVIAAVADHATYVTAFSTLNAAKPSR